MDSSISICICSSSGWVGYSDVMIVLLGSVVLVGSEVTVLGSVVLGNKVGRVVEVGLWLSILLGDDDVITRLGTVDGIGLGCFVCFIVGLELLGTMLIN